MLLLPLSTAFLLQLLPVALGAGKGLRPGQITTLITFGDSYTDVGSPADGGQAWPVYAASYANLTLYPFAKSGATCSNNITNRPFPSLFESQLPTFFEEKANGTVKTSRKEEEVLYTLWIGTNDVGDNGLLTGHGATGVTLVNTTSCAVNWVSVLYENGARNFLFQNVGIKYLLLGRLI
jgi:phospholipase/lecithinase/hemolysin